MRAKKTFSTCIADEGNGNVWISRKVLRIMAWGGTFVRASENSVKFERRHRPSKYHFGIVYGM